MFCSLKDKDFLFFSSADNTLPHHIRITYWPVRLFKHVGVSIWLFLHGTRIISEYCLDRLNIHAGPGGVLFIRKLPVPVFVTCHHTYWQQYTHIRSQFWKRIFLPFEQRTYDLADKIICDCEDTKQVLIERYNVPVEKITVIHCAVDTGKFHFENLPKKPDSLLYIGRIAKRKGIDFLIRSMPYVVRTIPDVRLLVGGKGSYLEKMKSLVRQLDLERNVIFLGFVPDDQLNTLYNQARCVVVPSVFEGFGITVIEALAAGTRVIGTDTDGIREILHNCDYGRLVPYGDTRALADAITAELREPKRAGELQPKYRAEMLRNRYLEVLGGGCHFRVLFSHSLFFHDKISTLKSCGHHFTLPFCTGKQQLMNETDIRNDDQWTTVLRSRSGWFDLHLKDLWEYRDLILLFVRRDFVSIYKQTILGPFWFLLQPLASTFIFTVVFGKIANIPTDGIPQPLFYMGGIVTWNYFASCLNRTSDTFVANEGIFGKVYFPRLAVPLSAVVINLLTFAIQFALFLVFMVFFGLRGSAIHPNGWILLTPLLLVQMGALGLGLGILISSLTTKYRDLSFILGFGVQLWMYATPIVYPMSQVPAKWHWLYVLNPVAAIVETFRYAFLGSGSVSPLHLGVSAGITVILLAAGIITFNRVEKTFMDTV